MAGKTLQIIFNGISSLWPGPPRNGDKTEGKAFVMMAANQKSDGQRGEQVNAWGTIIPEHFPFVRVAKSLLVKPPAPDDQAVSERREDYIYYFKDARVVIEPSLPPDARIEYFIDPDGHPLAERPGSDNVAKPSDIRWLADIREILPGPVPLKQTANPANEFAGPEVAAIVDLDGGVLSANFPCASVSPKTFRDSKTGKVLLRRVLADEFIIDIPYPAATNQVTLKFKDLKEEGRDAKALKELVLRWPGEETVLVVRMGNDTKEEVHRLDTPDRCDPVRRGGPVLKRRDDDFDLHYNFLKLPKDAERPLPQNDIQQCDFDGCKPGILGGGR